MKNVFAGAAATLGAVGIVTVISCAFCCQAMAADDIGGCSSNFSSSGNFFKGKQYKTTAALPNVKSAAAYDKTLQSVAMKGYQVVSTNKETGFISVAQQAIGSSGGKSIPMNIMVIADGAGSKLAYSVSITGGLMTSANAIRDEFCVITEEVTGS